MINIVFWNAHDGKNWYENLGQNLLYQMRSGQLNCFLNKQTNKNKKTPKSISIGFQHNYSRNILWTIYNFKRCNIFSHRYFLKTSYFMRCNALSSIVFKTLYHKLSNIIGLRIRWNSNDLGSLFSKQSFKQNF